MLLAIVEAEWRIARRSSRSIRHHNAANDDSRMIAYFVNTKPPDAFPPVLQVREIRVPVLLCWRMQCRAPSSLSDGRATQPPLIERGENPYTDKTEVEDE